MAEPMPSLPETSDTPRAPAAPPQSAARSARPIPLPRDGLGSFQWWDEQIDWARDVRQPLIEHKWRPNIRAYTDEVVSPSPEAIRVNIDFEKTEQKRHQLFFRVPTLKLTATPRTRRDAEQAPAPAQSPPFGGPAPESRDLRTAVRIFEEVLKHEAGEKGIDSKTLMDQLLFDQLCPAGISACKVGYERTTDGEIEVQIGEEPDPAAAEALPVPGGIFGLSAPTPMRPVMGRVRNVVDERYYASRISPGDLLIPVEFGGKHYARDCDWLGHEFSIPVHEAKRRGWRIPADAKTSEGLDEANETRLVPLADRGRRTDQLRCVELFYYAARVDADVAHPRRIRRLVFIKGIDEPAVHEDSRDQVFDGRGRFVQGIDQLPIKVLTLRYVSDAHYPPSDCTISRRQADELSEFRTQMVIHRRKSVPLRAINLERIADARVKMLIQQGAYYDLIPTDGDPNQLAAEVARPQYPRENFAIADHMMNDVNRQWGLGANQSATRETAGTTATEIAAIEKATATRLSGEQEIVLGYWLSIMETIGRLTQLYADREDYVEVVGETGAKRLEAWDRDTIRGEFLYTVVVDSSQRQDVSAERDLALNRYNLLRNDPYINHKELARQTVEVFGGDPDRLVVDPPPPPKDGPRVSASVKGDDLAPGMPQYPNVLALLAAAGLPAESLQPETSSTPAPAPAPGAPPEGEIEAAPVVDRQRLRMAGADNRSPVGGLQDGGGGT